ncbi:MAG: hypothetical protein ACJ0BN_17370 [Limisphaerales bacterium]
MIGRKNGMIALEDHVNEPASSSIFSKYPSLVKDKEAMDFLCDALRPIIDGGSRQKNSSRSLTGAAP